MGFRLGIDTGGTFTDAVLVDGAEHVVAAAKAETTHADLLHGIRRAVDEVLAGRECTIELIGLSTTLATNAIVEGRGGRAALLLLGLDGEILRRGGLARAVADFPVLVFAGGHDALGRPLAEPDLQAVEREFAKIAHQVEAAAIVGQFAVRNPGHERRVADMLRARFGIPCSCSHELSSRIDAPRRALTTFLNARLLPELDRLVRAAQQLLAERGLDAPLMLVRGDGSLMLAETARARPVETILSGPAASVVGAVHLSRLRDLFVVDVGGTTTDIALVERGRPRLAPHGAKIAGYETMVEAIALETAGLGGDSEVRRATDGRLEIGPRRAIPLSRLATTVPEIVDRLRAQAQAQPRELDGRFAVATVTELPAGITRAERELLERLMPGPTALGELIEREPLAPVLDRLLAHGQARLAAFTPTDAAHLLGRQTTGSVEAARLGALLEARKPVRGRRQADQPVELFARQVLEATERELAAAVVRAALDSGGEPSSWLDAARHSRALARALSPAEAPTGALVDVRLRLMRPVVGVGAPAPLLLPRPAIHLDTPLIVPPHHAVCNALGAVVGRVEQRVEIAIGRDEEGRFLVHLPEGTVERGELAAALELAEEAAARLARERAVAAGAGEVALSVERTIDRVEGADGTPVVLGARVRAVARGRPAIARR